MINELVGATSGRPAVLSPDSPKPDAKTGRSAARTGNARPYTGSITQVVHMKTLEEVRKIFEADRFATENGAVIEEIGDHSAVCSLVITPSHRNAMGAVMGGVYFMLADFAFAVAANWEQMGCVSIHSDISFLGAAKGKQLIARAVCVKNGRTTACYRVDVTDELGNLAATVTVTGCHVG